jgi:hypothetical protein
MPRARLVVGPVDTDCGEAVDRHVMIAVAA